MLEFKYHARILNFQIMLTVEIIFLQAADLVSKGCGTKYPLIKFPANTRNKNPWAQILTTELLQL